MVYDPLNEYEIGTNVVMVPNTHTEKSEIIKENYLTSSKFRASGFDGFMQNVVCMNRDLIIPFNIEPRVASLLELTSVTVNAIENFENRAYGCKDVIGVWGNGNVGFVTALVLKKLYPKSKIVVCGIGEQKMAYFSFVDEIYYVNDMPVNFYIQDGEIAVIGRGDLDEDYDVDSNDAIYLLRHVLMTSRYPISQNGDMNGDGVVNTDDAIYLLRSTLYPEEYPLSSIVDHTAAADAVYTPVANGFSTVCAECGKTFVIYERDMLLNLTYEGDYSKEIAKYPAFISSTSGLNIAEDRDGDKGHLNTDGKIVYLGIADRAALAKTGYYEMSFDYTPTGDGSTTSNGGEISVLTLVPGQYGATNVGELEYYWYFKYNVHQKKFEVIKAGTDTTKLDSTNSHSVEKNVKYKIRILCDIANKANYLYVNNTYVGKCPSYIDITNDTYKENISIRIGDNGAPSPIFDNFKVRTVK